MEKLHQSNVSRFFDQPGYLTNRFNIEIRRELVSELIGSPRGRTILDIGCGDGSISLDYAGDNHVTLIDGSPAMIRFARENVAKRSLEAHTTIIEDDFLDHQFAEPFDIALCIGVFAHVDDSAALLERLRAALVASGVLIIQMSDNDHQRYAKRASEKNSYGYELTRIGKKDFIELCASFGFELEASRSYSWSFPPLDRLPQAVQVFVLDWMRKRRQFDRFNSEYLFFFRKAR